MQQIEIKRCHRKQHWLNRLPQAESIKPISRLKNIHPIIVNSDSVETTA